MIEIKELNAAAAITAKTGQDSVLNERGEGLSGFLFPNCPDVTEAVALYFTDSLILPARQLLRVRGDLYRRLRNRGRV